MKFKFFLIALCTFSTAFAAVDTGLPACRAQLHDERNNILSEIQWREKFFMGSLESLSGKVLITTSLGKNQKMSLWVREDKEENQAGMFSFVDLSSGREQYLRFYMANGFSVGVTCQWSAAN